MSEEDKTRTEKIREKEGSVEVDTPSINTRDDVDFDFSKIGKALFWIISILLLALPVLLLKTYKDFMQIDEEKKDA